MRFFRLAKQSGKFFCCGITNFQHDQFPVCSIAYLEVLGSNSVDNNILLSKHIAVMISCVFFKVFLCLTRIFIRNHSCIARYTLRQRINLQWKYSIGYTTFLFSRCVYNTEITNERCTVSSRLCRDQWSIDPVDFVFQTLYLFSIL